MPDRSIWGCPSRYRRLSTASVASLLRQNSKPAIADNALFLGLLRASQVYICRKTFGYLLSCISRSDTGEPMPGSEGQHIYVLVKDGADVERFLRMLHARLWLAGLGWYVVGKTGQLLERSLVDMMVYAAERLVFEGPPRLEKPLQQDMEARRPQAFD